MEGAHGLLPTLLLMEQLAENTKRFKVKLSEKEIEVQFEKKEKLLYQLDLPAFQPYNEQGFEQWVDLAAAQISKHRLSVALFSLAWENAASETMTRFISQAGIPNDYETLVNAVALELFPNRSYVKAVEDELFISAKQINMAEAKQWVETRCAKYIRLCKRHKYPIGITDARLEEIALRALPKAIERNIRMSWHECSWNKIWHRATRVERELEGYGENPYHPHVALPAIDIKPGEVQRQGQLAKEPKRKGFPNPVCYACGQAGHYRKDCRWRDSRCAHCNKIGHTSAAYRNIAIKDNRGRVELCVESTPSDINIK